MTFTLDDGVCIPEDVFVEEIEGQSAILHLATERYFGLDDVGTRMWKALTTSQTIREAHGTLLADYDVSPDLLERDLLDTVGKLLERGLLTIRDT